MLMILLYHRSFAGRYGNSLETLKRHFLYLSRHHPIVLPSENLQKRKLNVCLSFDDATYDFYHNVYPLLKIYELKALLAVPVGYIEDHHTQSPSERLQALSSFSFQNTPPSYAFCSYKELKEMVATGHVEIASHGINHIDLSQNNTLLEEELKSSKNRLEEKLERPITSFVFPYGRYNTTVLKAARKHYSTVLRIGNGLNFSWKDALHFRVSADETQDITSLFSFQKKILYLMNKLKT